jgi:nicotinamidase-related amidase
MILNKDRSILLAVDIQGRLLPVMAEPDRVVRNTTILVSAAKSLAVPALATEQYPVGIGHIVPAVRELFEPGEIFEKSEFSCLRNAPFREHLATYGRRQVVLCGIESHVCVLQTAFDLLTQGYQPFVTADAVSSRDPENRALALDRLRAGGIAVVSTEMVVFEWLERSDIPEFKALSRLIK